MAIHLVAGKEVELSFAGMVCFWFLNPILNRLACLDQKKKLVWNQYSDYDII